MLAISVTEVPRTGELRITDRFLPYGEIELEEPFLTDNDARADFTIQRVREKFLVQGLVSAKAALSCDRCLEIFELSVQSTFLIEFEPETSVTEDLEDQPHVGLVADGKIHLGEELRQELITAIPFRKLCQKDCKGLCNVCGQNRNNDPCQCAELTVNRPLSGLNDLLNPGNTRD